MCNLSQGIIENGIEIGKEIATNEIINNMHKKGFSAGQIADVMGKEEKEVPQILEKNPA